MVSVSATNANIRLRWLVAIHLLLAATPLLSLIFTPSIQLLPLLWAVYAVPVGTLMTLSFWVGMGRQYFLGRLLIGLGGSAYVALWPLVVNMVQQARDPNAAPISWTMHYLSLAAPYAIVVILFGGMFMAMRLRWTIGAEVDAGITCHRLQFSVLSLLVIMSSVAVALTLMTASRGNVDATGPAPHTWQLVATYVLGFGAYFVNTTCAAHAALRPGPMVRNLLLVLLVSTLLGIALSIAARQDRSGWWLVAGGSFISIIPTMVVVSSLLVVRSCGYRLVRNSTATPVAPLTRLA